MDCSDASLESKFDEFWGSEFLKNKKTINFGYYYIVPKDNLNDIVPKDNLDNILKHFKTF